MRPRPVVFVGVSDRERNARARRAHARLTAADGQTSPTWKIRLVRFLLHYFSEIFVGKHYLKYKKSQTSIPMRLLLYFIYFKQLFTFKFNFRLFDNFSMQLLIINNYLLFGYLHLKLSKAYIYVYEYIFENVNVLNEYIIYDLLENCVIIYLWWKTHLPNILLVFFTIF